MSENTDASAANLDEPTDERTRGRKANQGQENLIKVIKKEKKKMEGRGENNNDGRRKVKETRGQNLGNQPKLLPPRSRRAGRRGLSRHFTPSSANNYISV